MAKHYDVVVLGASLGALTTAALLARRSWRVLVVGQGYRSPTYSYKSHVLMRRPFAFLAHRSSVWQSFLAELAQTQLFRRFMIDGRLSYQFVAPSCAVDCAGQLVLPPEVSNRCHDTRRVIVESLTHFGADAAPRAETASRVVESWGESSSYLVAGEAGLRDFLERRITAHGGELRLGESARAIVCKRGEVSAIEIERDPAPIGTRFLVSDLPNARVAALIDPNELAKYPHEKIGRVDADGKRFVMTILAKNEGIPEHFDRELFLASGSSSSDGAVRVHRAPPEAATRANDCVTLVAETILPSDDAPTLACAREHVLGVLERFFPFVEEHYVMIDSPHDARSLWDYRAELPVAVERDWLRAGGGSVYAEPMETQWAVSGEGESVRGLLSNLFNVSRTVMPSLGQEGELAAAWEAAEQITRTDKRREKLWRETLRAPA